MLHRCSLLMAGCSCVSITLLSQPRLKLLAGIEFSTTNFNYHFDQNGSVLKRGVWDKCGRGTYPGIHYTAGLHFRATKQLAVEIGFQKVEMDLEVYDNQFIANNNLQKQTADAYYRGISGKNTNYDVDKLYNGGYIQIYYFANPNGWCQPYLSAGVSKNWLDSRTMYETASFYYDPTNEHTTFTAHYPTKYFSEFIETGLSWSNHPKSGPINFFMGVKWCQAGQILAGDYSNTGGAEEYTDHVTASGSYLSFCFKLGYTLGHSNQSRHKAHRSKLRSKPAPIQRDVRRIQTSYSLIIPPSLPTLK